MGSGSSTSRAPPAPHGSIVVTHRLMHQNPRSVEVDNYLEEGRPQQIFGTSRGPSTSSTSSSGGSASSSPPRTSDSYDVQVPAGEEDGGIGSGDQYLSRMRDEREIELRVLEAKNAMLEQMAEAERLRIQEKTAELRKILQLDILRKTRPHPCQQEETTLLNCLDQREDFLRCANFVTEYQVCAANAA
ncbi:unnamed protein product [Amoebophrya sp. A120]|nr:unnamed protein product [Amoebophrya sp. A120]|eukprot:GSA120T00005151001.1